MITHYLNIMDIMKRLTLFVLNMELFNKMLLRILLDTDVLNVGN